MESDGEQSRTDHQLQHHLHHHHHPPPQQRPLSQQSQRQRHQQEHPQVQQVTHHESQQIISSHTMGRTKLAEEGNPPELPPRPHSQCPRHADVASLEAHLGKARLRKYVFLCSICGGLASALGCLFFAVYQILRSHTSSLNYFETIPTYIPAIMLFITGLGIMCLARRRNRYALLIKLCGVCCLLSASMCVLVTVTTTVIHMSRLQSLRECVYTIKTQTCTCYSMLLESATERNDEGVHYVFNSTPDCEVIHGTLYSCLRAMFGLSVVGILVCIFCCMLVYQLLSHERKKMYWEQLELRCRYLYGQPRNQTSSAPARCSHCACSQQIRYPSEAVFDNSRLWAGGRIGNLYSPNPVGDEPTTNSSWGWRLPWNRGETTNNTQNNDGRESVIYHRPIGCSSPDSQYGFSAQGVATVSSATSNSYTMIEPQCQPFQWGPPPPYSDPNSPRRQCMTHSCHETYVNTGPPQTIEELRTMRSRRMPDSSSSSVKSSDERRPKSRNDPGFTSPKGKIIKQSNSHNHKRQISDSEVYFADVSSCCNGSIRNDSLVYDEPINPDNNPNENIRSVMSHNHVREHAKKQPRYMLDRNLRLQLEKEFQKIPEERASPEALSEMALDGSEDDDPELVSFSQRHASRNRISESTRAQCRNRMDLTQMSNDFPSPMSISSPSTTSKDIQFYPDTVNSENGSADSAWGRYSPEFLAPDAQYETIPDPRPQCNESPNNMKSPSKNCNSEWRNYQDQNSSDMRSINSPIMTERKISNEKRIKSKESSENSSPSSLDSEQQTKGSNVNQNIINSRKLSKFSNMEKLNSSALKYDRCGNISTNYFKETRDKFERPQSPTMVTNSNHFHNELIHSPKHHYEQIRGETPQHYESCDNLLENPCFSRNPSMRMDNVCLPDDVEFRNNSHNLNKTVNNSPKLFEKRLFSSTNSCESPDCLTLVDESQCCHNDSNCRCFLGIDNNLSTEQLKSVDILQ